MTSEQAQVRREVRRLAKSWGCIVDTTDGEVNVDAPHGYTWASDPGVHELVNSPWDSETQDQMWVEALRRMSAGLEACDCEECASKRGVRNGRKE